MNKTELAELQRQEEALIEVRSSIERKLKGGSKAVTVEKLAEVNEKLAKVQKQIGESYLPGDLIQS